MRKTFFYISLFSVLTLINSCKDNKPANDNVLKVDIGAEVSSLDPALASDGTTFRVINDLFAGLVDFDQKDNPIPGIATSWDISSDDKTYTFHLQKNLKFSDGSPLTAKDIVYTWKRLVDPKTGAEYAFLLNDVVGAPEINQGKKPVDQLAVSAPDDDTFIVHLSHLNSAFLSYLTVPSLGIVSQKNIEKYGSLWIEPQNMVNSGAYKLSKHVLNGYILVSKNPNFYNADNVTIPQVKFFPYIDTNASLNNFSVGQLDTTWQNVPIDQYEQVKKKYPTELHTWNWERTEFIHLNMNLAKYKDNPKLRQALSMAIDRNVLTSQVLNGGQSPLYSVATPTIQQGIFKDNHYSWSSLDDAQRIAEAKQLYSEAGYSNKNPLKITILYRNNDLYKKVALSVAAMLYQTLGVEVTVQATEWKTLLRQMKQGDYDMAMKGGWGADYNSVTTYTQLYECKNPNNVTFYCNAEYDALITKAKNANSEAEQLKYYQQAVTLVNNDYPVITLYEPVHQRLVSNRVKNYQAKENYLDNVQSKWMGLK